MFCEKSVLFGLSKFFATILSSTEQQHHLLDDFYQTVMSTNLYPEIAESDVLRKPY